MPSSRAPMKTEISRFCQDYSEILLPLRAMLGKDIDFIRDQKETEDLKGTLSDLCDVHHRMKNLADKVASQQAYVIIFGPLKSGKSTLMNAFSAAYVSEVTALPAYPCLVHVRHEERTNIVASRFNGQTERFTDFKQMQEAISMYHRELAEQIRQVEEQGETFDPGVHCPQAIRRLDIGLPAEPLKESYTILVDTPGLYSRMKFGYDLMSREFRDSAACAVFVVKTDNLFLEQVFQEFGDLLDLFSRIFLVVNIDANKCDLGPEGELRPSLESFDPQRIVDAFCSLSMTAPLRKAYDQGRLKIYPIDLLHAATERLSGNDDADQENRWQEPRTEAAGEETDESHEEYIEGESGDGASEETEAAIATETRYSSNDNFNEFMSDMTTYLNSNDYLIHFMSDSLRQGRKLIQEIDECCDDQHLESFLHSLSSLELTYNRESSRRQALTRLTEMDWSQAFAGMHKQILDAAANFVEDEQVRLTEQLIREVDEWFENTAGLSVLLNDKIDPSLNHIPESVQSFVMDRIQTAADTPWNGAELSNQCKQDLERAGMSLGSVREKALANALRAGRENMLPEEGISPRAMPVSRGFWDWILLRSMNRVREKLFGPDEDPSRDIPVKVKQTRLGAKSREAFCEVLENHIQEIFNSMVELLSREMVEAFMNSATSAVQKHLNDHAAELDRSLPRLKKRIQTKEAIRQTLQKMGRETDAYDQKMEELEQAFAHLHPEMETFDDEDLAEPEDDGEENQENDAWNQALETDDPSPAISEEEEKDTP